MAWSAPNYSKRQIDHAGKVLAGIVADGDRAEAFTVMDNWRSSHAFPLNTLQMGLRQRTKAVDAGGLVAQRLKRAHSIIFKLERFPSMNLARMQDLGGARAVVGTVVQVRELLRRHDSSLMRHEMVKEHDYIATPKESGYRSIHRVYRYRTSNANQQAWDGLLIELQFRTRLQHSWATAVETMGTFLDQSLKSSHGEAEWLDFFRHVSSAFAELEDEELVLGTPQGVELAKYVREESIRLDVVRKLNQFRSALHFTSSRKVSRQTLFLLVLSKDGAQLTLEPLADIGEATRRYGEVEKQIAGTGADAVLVRAASLEALRAAYPNYFIDTEEFIRRLDAIYRRARAG